MESALDLILLAAAWAHVFLAPYTKVEESFNLHAAHDVFFHGVSKSALRKYDHFVFPGVVPRSFVGSVFLGGTARPVVALLSKIGLVQTKLDVQIISKDTDSRNIFQRIKASIWRRFGRRTAILFALLSAIQFHLPFWMGRTLPNMLALIPFNEALAQMISIDGSSEVAVVMLTFAAVVFRAELAVYLAVYGFFVLLKSRVKFKRLFFIEKMDVAGAARLELQCSSGEERGMGGTILGTLAITSLLTHISYSNYPGGEALYLMNQIKLENVNLHVGNLAAQSGASLFLQEHSSPFLSLERNLVARPGNWTYDKTEHLLDLHPYSHAIVESLEMVPDWKIEGKVYAFDGLSRQ
ncbi:12684_t:CDS:2, partial [Acaulospora colombiana]